MHNNTKIIPSTENIILGVENVEIFCKRLNNEEEKKDFAKTPR
jgi:hypothetical protein